MDANKVFVGLDKYNEESIFYKYKWSNDIYRNIVTNELVYSGDLQLNTFCQYHRAKLVRSMSELRKTYKADRSFKLKIGQVYLGNVYRVGRFLTREVLDAASADTAKQVSLELKEEVNKHDKIIAGQRILVKEKALLALVDQEQGIYGGLLDLVDGYFYPYKFELQTGDMYIPEKKGALKIFAKEANIEATTLEKSKVISKYREFIRGE